MSAATPPPTPEHSSETELTEILAKLREGGMAKSRPWESSDVEKVQEAYAAILALIATATAQARRDELLEIGLLARPHRPGNRGRVASGNKSV